MKSFLFTAIFLMSSLVLADSGFYSCRAFEAQFIGNVVALRMERTSEGSTCYFQVQTYMFNPNYICPLDIAEVSNYEFTDASCLKRDGERIGGMMYKMDGVIHIE